MGFSYNCCGLVGTLVSGILMDRYKCYKLVGCVLTLGSLLLWVVFSYLLLYVKHTLSLFIVFTCLSFFAVPYFSVGVEQLAETTYPVPEGTSSAVAMTIGNAYSFIAILLLGHAVDGGYRTLVCYVVGSVYVCTFPIISCVKMDMRREEEEKRHSGNSDR